MEGVDKEKVQRIVYEMSKGSKYFQNEERKEALMKQKIHHMRDRCAKLSSSDLSNYHKVVDRRILELEATRDLSRVWLHVDMDAFYAAVETLSNPSLKGKPMAVGGMSMISTANYEARKFGVRAAMPGFIARKLCPDLIFVPVDFTKYTHYSDLTRKVFSNYDPNFSAGSLDEAFLDITEVCRERGLSGGEIAEELRSSVYSETGLTCSAGVAANRLLAKVCSDINKPNGQFVLENDRSTVMAFISSLPIRKIGGIGKVTEHILKDALGIKTCEEIVQKGSLLYALFSQSSADFFLSVGLELGKTDTPEVRSRKSISSERTFSATGDERLLFLKLAEIAEMLSDDRAKYSDTQSHEIADRVICSVTYGIVVVSCSSLLSYLSLEEVRLFAQKKNLIPIFYGIRPSEIMGLLNCNAIDKECKESIDGLIKSHEFKLEANETNWRSCVGKTATILRAKLGRKSVVDKEIVEGIDELPFPRNKSFLGSEKEILEMEMALFGNGEYLESTTPSTRGKASGQSEGLADEESDVVSMRNGEFISLELGRCS